MLKLMKYELYRRKTLFISILLIIAFLESAVLFGIHKGGNWSIMSVAFTFIILIGGLLFPFIDTIVNYYSDYKNKHGYMLFLTPNSGHKIIGSKTLFAFIELIVMVAIIIGSLILSYLLLNSIYPIAASIDEIMQEFQQIFNIEKFTIWSISPLILLTIIQYFNNIMLAVLALTIGKTILSNNNFNWLFALLIYFGLSIVVQFVNTGALVVFGFAGDMIDIIKTGSNDIPNIVKYLCVAAGCYVFWIITSIVVSSKLLDKRTDL